MKPSFCVSQPCTSWSKGNGAASSQEAISHQNWGMGTRYSLYLSAVLPLPLQSLEFQPLMHPSISSALALFLPLSIAAPSLQRTLRWAPSWVPSNCNLHGKSLERSVRLPERQSDSSSVFLSPPSQPLHNAVAFAYSQPLVQYPPNLKGDGRHHMWTLRNIAEKYDWALPEGKINENVSIIPDPGILPLA